MEEKCYIYNEGKISRKKIDYVLYGINLGKFTAEVCGKCGEVFFGEKTSEKMTRLAKEKGLWGLAAKTKIGLLLNSQIRDRPKDIYK